MASTPRDVIVINLVLVGVELLGTQEQVQSFAAAVEPDLRIEPSRTTNLSTGETEQGKTIAIDRERITIESAPSRSSINRQYPSETDFYRFAEVVSGALEHSDLNGRKPRSFGYNLEAVFDQDSGDPALLYLGQRILGAQPLGNTDWNFVGATSRSIFTSRQGQWTLALEPRFNNPTTPSVFLSLNLHKDEQIVPSKEEVETSLMTIWKEAQDFMNRLDQRSAT
jgi:hypothetical protein